MFIVAVNIWVKSEFVAPFVEAILDNARNTRQEEGNLRFDVIQAEDDPARFMLYEVYRSREDFVKHQQTPHYLRWKDKVTDWMARPREALKAKEVFYG